MSSMRMRDKVTRALTRIKGHRKYFLANYRRMHRFQLLIVFISKNVKVFEMATRPQTEKLKRLNLLMCVCGRLFSAKPGAFCKKCGPDDAASPMKTCKRGHARTAERKRCSECDKARRNASPASDPAPIVDEALRQKNRDAAEARKARRAGLGQS